MSSSFTRVDVVLAVSCYNFQMLVNTSLVETMQQHCSALPPQHHEDHRMMSIFMQLWLRNFLGSLGGALLSKTDWTRSKGRAMDGLWPGLDPNLLVVFQGLFSTPLSLQAAFDDEAECCILLESVFPDMVEEEVRNVAAELMVWQSENAPSFKRMRLGTVSQNLCKLPPQNVRDIQTSFTALTQSSTITVLEFAAKKRQRKYKDEHPDARARKLDTERHKYTILWFNLSTHWTIH